jgi:hypothetical protein
MDPLGFDFPHADSVNLGLNTEGEIDVATALASPVPVG